jgi:hypothetical protein
MHQNQLERSVARATGESRSTIRRIGFSIFDPEHEPHDLDDVDLVPSVVDWDRVEFERIALACQA